jgi:hypothetical protein
MVCAFVKPRLVGRGRYLYTLVFASVVMAGCAIPLVVERPAADVKVARDAEVLASLGRVGRNGDWLVIRGYHITDNLVSAITNMPWSHAAVLDMSRMQVVEADGTGVHETALSDFVAKSHRLILIRPNWSTEQTGMEATERARALAGKRYDFLGLIGLNVPDNYYCSELAVVVYQRHIPTQVRIPRPVAPSQLHFWGRILYDSGDP